jgi:hypothetical protein
MNPEKNVFLNPMFRNELHPKSPDWKGSYLFDKNDELIGYVSKASQNVLLVFDANSQWTGYFIRATENIYNEFTPEGTWTGRMLCSDSMSGFNLFDNEGKWTGKHVK